MGQKKGGELYILYWRGVLLTLWVAVILDWRTWRVPNVFLMLCSITSSYLLIIEYGVWGCLLFLWRLIWPVLLLYGVYKMRGLGAGDIKLFAVVSTVMESQDMLWLILHSIVVGAVYGLFRMFKKKQRCSDVIGVIKQSIRCFVLKQKVAYISQGFQGEKIHFTWCIFLAYVGFICKEGVV